MKHRTSSRARLLITAHGAKAAGLQAPAISPGQDESFPERGSLQHVL